MPRPDTIFALSSGHGVAGIAVVRMSGPAVRLAVQYLSLGDLRPRVAKRVTVLDPQSREIIDSALALLFTAPASFTGEDVLELHVHGGRAVLAATLSALSRIAGCRLADAGEFTRRAFHNGKLDLTEAEGLADLIAAETEAQRKQALRVSGGALRALYSGWRAQLIEAMALMEAALDFSDEADVAANAIEMALLRIGALQGKIAEHLNDERRGEILRDGLRLVIAGPPNAGKSSLLNALARRDVAIVSPEPGTTRDVVEARLDLGGLPVIVSDTAGIRSTPASAVEREGIRRSFARSAEADLVLWLIDATNPEPKPPQELLDQAVPVIAVLNKIDLARPTLTCAAEVSTVTGEGLTDLLSLLTDHAKSRLTDHGAPAITTVRQRALIEAAANTLADFQTGDATFPELRAEDLRKASQSLGRVTGQVDVEDVLDRLFGSFCIGK